MTFWDQTLTFSEQATLRIGQQLLKDFGTVSAGEKADGSLVTRSDQWADEELRHEILSTFPDHGVLSEEVEHVCPETDWCWVIDPIDGTNNFARGIPIWGISLGLLYQGTPVFGYVYFPPLNQSFWGYWPGDSGLDCPNGAFLNSKPIHTSAAEPSGTQFFSICSRSTGILNSPDPFPCKVRMIGAATYELLIVAAGITLGGVAATPKIWDIAAVWAICHAAGVVWLPLENSSIFPLEPGKNYGRHPFPTLAVSREDLIPVFRPWVERSVQ